MNPIGTLAQPFKLAKSTAKMQRDLNERIDALNAEIEKHNAAVAALAQAGGDMDLLCELDDRGEELRKEALRLLSLEFRLRQDALEYFHACNADKSDALTRACEEQDAAREEVMARLLDAGFEMMEHPSFGRCIPPQVMFLHPRIRRAREDVARLQGMLLDAEPLNRQRLEAIHIEAVALRRKAVALASR